MKKLYCLFFCLALLGPTAHAGLLVEPFFGYENGSFTQTKKDDASGLNYGGRIGYLPQRVGMGYELSFSQLEVESTTLEDYKIKDQGVFVLYQLSFGRLWGSYIFQSEARRRDGDFFEGKGYRLGIGLLILRKASLNFEKLTREYNKLNQSQLDSTLKMDTFILSLSVPLP